MADDVDLSIPAPPPAEKRRRLAELAAWHDQWATRHMSTARFRPGGRPAESDYGQHFTDLDAAPAAEDEFHARARQIMGITTT